MNKSKVLSLLFFLLINQMFLMSQENKSNIEVKGDENQIKVDQKSMDSSRGSNESEIKIDGNKTVMDINQLKQSKSDNVSVADTSEKDNIWSFFNKTNIIVSILAGLITILFLVFPKLTKGQNPKNNSNIGVLGNNNVVKVYQGDNNIVYDLDEPKQRQQFLNYLKNIPSIKKQLDRIEADEKNILSVVKKIERQVEYFNPKEFAIVLEKYINEIGDLKNELAVAREKIKKSSEFSKILEWAADSLKKFDHEGYQLVLEKYKQAQLKKDVYEKNELAQVSFFQAKESRRNFLYEKALEQISEALEFDSTRNDFLLFKAQTLFELGYFDASIESAERLITSAGTSGFSYNLYELLARNFLKKSLYQESLKYHSKALEVAKADSGSGSFEVAQTLSNIGIIYEKIGRYELALSYYENSLSICKKLSDTNTIEVGFISNNIGAVYHKMGNYIKSIEYYQKAIDILNDSYGEGNIYSATFYNNLAASYHEIKNYTQALSFHQSALKIRKMYFDEAHPSVAESYNGIANCFLAINNPEEAIKYLEKAVSICLKYLGEDNELTAICISNLGTAYNQLKEPLKALENHMRSLKIRINIFGEEHMEVANSYNNVGTTLVELKRNTDGIIYLRNALKICERIVGINHPYTKMVILNINKIVNAP